MNVNPAIIPTVVLAALAFLAGLTAGRRASTWRARCWLIALGAVLALPGMLLAVHYLHLLDRSAWYFSLRAVPWMEVSAGGAGFLAGAIWALPLSWRGRKLRYFGPGCLVLMILGLATPYAKQLMTPLSWPEAPAKWENGVCMQSTEATCGPASAATILRSLGIEATERELAVEGFTSATGTECWYLARALRHRGLRVDFAIGDPADMPIPSYAVAGQDLSGAGHFVAILDKTKKGHILADPLYGRRTVPEDLLRRHESLTGFFMIVSRSSS